MSRGRGPKGEWKDIIKTKNEKYFEKPKQKKTIGSYYNMLYANC